MAQEHHRTSCIRWWKHHGLDRDFIVISHRPAHLQTRLCDGCDNARTHGAAIVDDFLECERIAGMERPAYSLDLNPNEKFKDVLGRPCM
ncbi:hypothetical protein TNCV_3701571 [Trichonephila clavipes]|nr:hypothetical protein TNCV_3701571 [Trichonephila clavipes]